ncbi:MAG TPA: M28 family peptidase [Longimicrobiaceae bacterium]|nr:M28 family peptidase [Longimicrobiaceae bacterium]
MTKRPRGVRPALLLALLAGCRPAVERPEFPPDLAWSFLTTQMAFGPRYAGHRGHDRQLEWLREQLAARADTVLAGSFTHRAADGATLRLTNLLARFRPELPRRVLLAAHWDTRRYADQSAPGPDRRRPIPGANDGAAGTAVLLGLAELLAQQPPEVGVDLLFTDGDDYGPGAEDMSLGTRHYLASSPPGARAHAAVVVDMVGERRARFPREGFSLARSRWLVDGLWATAGGLGLDTVFVADSVPPVPDGRLRLLAMAGIPAAIITDPEYGPGNRYWHTVDDQVRQLDRASLGAVGEVLAEWVYRVLPREERP